MPGSTDAVASRFQLPDGRRLAWYERGDPNGSVVFAFHGLPGSRLQVHPDERIASAAGARVIHVDRPGWGLSDPMPGRRIGDWPTDIAALADHLHVDRFAVAGVSGGGPFAAACAAQLGNRVTRTGIISGVGPPGTMSSALSLEVRVAFKAAASMPGLLWLPLMLSALFSTRAPGFCLDWLIGQLPVCDREILRRPDMRAMLLTDMVEAFRQGHHAFLEDLQLEARPWGVALERASCPVALWHGSLDTVVPPQASEAVAALLPVATVKMFPQAGHFLVFDIWGEILAWLLA